MAGEKYTKDHEWVRVDGDSATVGISDFAQKSLGDVVFVEMPSVGRTVAAHEVVAVVDSVKASSEIFAPVSGVVTAVNTALVEDGDRKADTPLINSDPLGKGWFFKLKLANKVELDGLMDKAAYDTFCATA